MRKKASKKEVWNNLLKKFFPASLFLLGLSLGWMTIKQLKKDDLNPEEDEDEEEEANQICFSSFFTS